ncbi:MAG TPA: hypothetical protein VMA09_12500 [Candidatus Binataceae bacterium]|nr:hypothetical protein [Candidatus Binataceae bacterium]
MRIASAALSILTALILMCAAGCSPSGQVCNSGETYGRSPALPAQTCDDYYAQLHAEWANRQ